MRLVQIMLFLLGYLVSLTGKLLIVAITTHDRHLHTPVVIMDDGACGKMAAASWLFSALRAMMYIIITFSFPVWRSNVQLEISRNFLTEIVSVGLTFRYFLTIVISYAPIFRAMLRMPTVEGWDKAFPTCLPQLAIMTLFTVVSPALNSLNYSLRSRDTKVIMDKGAWGKMTATSWLSGGIFGVMYTTGTLTLSFYGSNLIQQFICDIPFLLKISCSRNFDNCFLYSRNLSVLDLYYISATVPKSILNSLINNRSIYFRSYVAQVFLVVLFADSELFIFTAMSYDRFAAVCRPLRYNAIFD
ncbi:olfactory receptor 14A16-like [Tachyglossus aculeatus]|uniref:olfactory receptor 14A16-like n=1 Tax=Tachyglossus aculeatus TaxID=9261 RepID=UPI0018F55573|nr:olfactory receptor 14A16-like [Tachyglossus aculeatus]